MLLKNCQDTNVVLDDQAELETEWNLLTKELARARASVAASQELQTLNDQLRRWIVSKRKMLTLVGTLTVDPKLLDNQLLQLEVTYINYTLCKTLCNFNHLVAERRSRK